MAFTSQRGRGGSSKQRTLINKHQNGWPQGYVSTYPNSRRPEKSLSDLTNMEIVLDNTPRPRSPMIRYGIQPAYPVIGRGNYRFNGIRGMLFMLNVNGVGKVATQIDGGNYTIIGGTYDVTAPWAMFKQSNGRVYIYNSKDALTYLQLSNMTILSYTSLATPVISSLAKGGLAGTTYPQWYRISANNAVGESIASVAVKIDIGKPRDSWAPNTTGNPTDYIDVAWGAVTGATSYTVYTGNTATVTEELMTVTGTSYRDDGSRATNFSKLAPEGDSTAGAIFRWMYNDTKNSQLFGVDNNNQLYYSSPGTGDFSPYNGGGNVGIDVNGDTQLNYVDGFRTGKGDPVITVSSRGAAGKGQLKHVTFESLTIGDQILYYPNVFEANGQSATYAPRATIKARDALYYPTGKQFKTTGTSQNVNNILTTQRFDIGIEPDLATINLNALDGAVGIEKDDILYYALPINSGQNSEIWLKDLARNLWILRWTIPAKDLWLYEDNAGATHFCILVNNIIMEFSRIGTTPTTDDNVPFKTRVAFSGLVFDDDAVTLASIKNMYIKLLEPRGTIKANAYGINKKGVSDAVGSDIFKDDSFFTNIGIWDYSGNYRYGDDPGIITNTGKAIDVLKIKPKGLLNQLDWEIVTEIAGCDYFLSAVNSRGIGHSDLIYKG